LKKAFLCLKLAAAAIVLVAAYRIYDTITEPEILFYTGHLVFVVCLFSWMVFLSARTLVQKKPVSQPLQVLVVCVLICGAFGVTGAGFAIQGKTIPYPVPFMPFSGIPAHVIWACTLFCLLAFSGYVVVCRFAGHADPCLYPLACLLTGIGFVFLFRLGPDLYQLRDAMTYGRLFPLQARSAGLALAVFLGSVLFFSPDRLDSLTRKRYIYVLLSIVLISITALFGKEMHGRKLAVDFKVISFQTVELVKVLALFFMVGYFRYEGRFIESGKNRLKIPRLRYLMPYLTLWFLTLLPIFLQKDLGPTALIFVLFMVVFYLGTGSGISVLTGLAILLAAGAAAYAAQFPSMVKTRVDMWLNPFAYSHNMSEALWAIAGGGWFGAGTGRGLGHHVPVVQSDFNFILVAEEWGIAGVFSLFAVFFLLFARILSLAEKASPPYLQLLTAGLGALWIIQTLIIVGGNAGLIPLTGITLPFISFGGSSLLVNFMILGMLVRLSHEINRK